MEEDKVANKIEQLQKDIKKEKIPLWIIIIIIVGVLLVLWRTVIMGSGDVVDYIFRGLGGLAGTVLFAFILGLIPYFLMNLLTFFALKRSFNRLGLTIFSVSFLIVSIITFISSLYLG